jgi:Fe-S-cluster containining protein
LHSPESPCRACGACCAHSAQWPRFSLETDLALSLIPPALIDKAGGCMRCAGDRCAALEGKVGVATACTIYAVRPEVCRACLPGDDECRLARQRAGLAAITSAELATLSRHVGNTTMPHSLTASRSHGP